MRVTSPFLRSFLVPVAGAVIFLGCAHTPSANEGWAIQIADRKVQSAGHRLGDFKKPTATFFQAIGSDHKDWFITYHPLVPQYGRDPLGKKVRGWVLNELCVSVDPVTGSASFVETTTPN